MNILPKKRWHVRTKENIARVRKDEAEAAEKERVETSRTEQADREARLRVLKQKSKQKLQEFGIKEPPEASESVDHINLFANFEDAVKTKNKEHDTELKEKKEEYEKKIGYLTYLGQDTNEALGKKNWYEVPPDISRASRSSSIKDTYDKLVLKDEDGKPKLKESDEKNGEVCWKKKQMIDPMNAFKNLQFSNKEKKNSTQTTKIMTNNYDAIAKKHKDKHKGSKYDKNEDKEKKLHKLREARLKREQHEKYRTEMFLKGLCKPLNTDTKEDNKVKAKYNSQFNPELARQNYR